MTYTLPATGAYARAVSDRLADRISVLDFIPETLHAGIRARTDTTDLASYFNAAISHLDSVGGGELYIPAGRYRCGSTIALCRKLRLQGASRGGTNIQFTHAGTGVPDGSGFKSVAPSNDSTPVNVKLSDLWIEMLHASNVGAGFYDNGGTYVTLRDCSFAGGKFGIVFDQTEVSGIYTCEMAGQLSGGAGLWLVNGDDITSGNSAGYTNQITVDHNCQFNQSSAYAVIDDGGDCHYFGNNNVNGGGLKFCGVANLTIMGGEFESVNGRPTLTFTYLKHYQSSSGVGACSAVICNGLINQPSGQPCISIVSLYNLHMTRMSLTATGTGVTGCVMGTENVGTLFARQNANYNSAVPVFNTYSASTFDDGFVRTTSSSAGGIILDAYNLNSHLLCTSGSAVTVTVPANATLPFPIGTWIMVEQNGSGAVTLSPATGVTLNGTLSTAAQYQLLTLRKTGTDRWLVTRQA